MFKKPALIKYLDQSVLSQQDLISIGTSSRSLFSNLSDTKGSNCNVPTSQLKLVQQLGLKQSPQESPTEMFLSLATKFTAPKVLLSELQAEYKASYSLALAQTGVPEYLQSVQMSAIEISKARPTFSLYQRLTQNLWISWNLVSVWCRSLLAAPLFQLLTTLTIILNSIVIANYDPLSNTTTPLEQRLQIFFLSFYSAELVIKVMGNGLIIGRNSYLRSFWNLLDLLIIATSFSQLFFEVGFSANSLRVFRVLRPLRTITKIPSLKMVIKTLFASFSLVFDSIILLTITIVMFGILGLQLFAGVLKHRCMDIDTGLFLDALCSNAAQCQKSGADFKCVKGIPSPNFSMYNFDTISMCFLSIFQIITMEDWSTIMIDLEKAYNWVGAVYCIAIIFVCQLALLNITLAILKYKFSEIRSKGNEPLKARQEGYSIATLKKTGMYSSLSNVRGGVLIPHELIGRIGAASLHRHKMFNLQDETGTSKFVKCHRTSGQLKSVTNHVSYEVARESNFKGIKLFQEGPKPTFKIAHKEIQYRLNLEDQQNKYSDEEQLSYLMSTPSESMEDIKTQNLVENDDQKHEEMVEAVERNNRLFSLISPKTVTTSQHRLFLQTRNQLDTVQGLEHKSNQNNQLLQIVLNSRKFLQFRSKKQIQPQSPQPRKNPRHYTTFRKSIQQLKQQQQLNINKIKLLNQIRNRRLCFQVKQSVGHDLHYRERAALVLKYDTLQTTGLSWNRLDISYAKTGVFVEVRTDGFIKIAIRGPVDRVYRSNNILNTHSMTQQQDIINEGMPSQTKERFKITFQKTSKARKVPKKPKTTKILSLQDVDRQYFNICTPSQNAKPSVLPVDQVCLTEQELRYPNQANKDIWKTLCTSQTQLKYLHLRYPPCEIITTPFRKFVAVHLDKTSYSIYIPGFWGTLNVLHNYITIAVQSSSYDYFILGLVIANTAVLCFPTTSPNGNYQVVLNQLFTAVFTLDVILKIITYGLDFFEDFLNLFDLLVVILSLFQLTIIGQSSTNMSAFRAIRIFRVFRVLRVTRLIRSLSFMSVINDIVAGVFVQFIYIFLLLGLFLFVYVLLGMQIFGGTFAPQSITGVRQNFDTFWNAFFAIFQLITVQNWNDLETAVALSSTNTLSVIYLILGIFLGNWVLLNLIQAILLQNFEAQRVKIDQQKNVRQQQRLTTFTSESHASLSRSRSVALGGSYVTKSTMIFQRSRDYSWWVFSPSNPVRRCCIRIVMSKWFNYAVYGIILCSCCKLIFDTYINATDTDLQLVSSYLNLVVNVSFILEFLIRTISSGFIFSQHAYINDNWNKLDLLILVSCILDFAPTSVNIGIIKVFRAIRPLKLISRNLRMRIIIQALVHSANGIANVGLVIILSFVMFGILYMNLLQGKLNYCDTGQGEVYGPYKTSQADCSSAGFTWRTRIINFQNIADSLLSLFIFSTRENWPFYHYTFVDGDQSGPLLGSNPVLFLFLSMGFILICSYFLVDLFIGVIFMKYHTMESKLNPKRLSPQQNNWVQLQEYILTSKPHFLLHSEPKQYFKRKIFQVIGHKFYHLAISIILVLNAMVFMSKTDDVSSTYSRVLLYLNCSFSLIFLLEIALKLYTFPICQYFMSVFNILQTLVGLAGIVDFIQLGELIQQSPLLDALNLLKVARVFRLLSFIKTYKSLQKLIYILVYALPSLGSVASLLCLYLLIGSVISSTLFGDLVSDYTLTIDQDHNFVNFHNALQTLFICLTGQNWYYYMFASMNTQAQCMDQSACTNPYNFLFWVPFIFIGQKILLELFVLLILDQFEDTFIRQNNPYGLFSDLEAAFRSSWVALASRKDWSINSQNCVELCLQLKHPLGLGCNEQLSKFQCQLDNGDLSNEEVVKKRYLFYSKLRQSAMKWVSQLEFPNRNLHYHRVFYSFAKSVLAPEQEQTTDDQLEILEEQGRQATQYLNKIEGGSDSGGELMNPLKRQLLIQIVLEAWTNFADINSHLEDWQEQDSLLEELESQPRSMTLISFDRADKPKLMKAPSIKVGPKFCHKSSHKSSLNGSLREVTNPQLFYLPHKNHPI